MITNSIISSRNSHILASFTPTIKVHHMIPSLSTYRAEYFRAYFSQFFLQTTFSSILLKNYCFLQRTIAMSIISSRNCNIQTCFTSAIEIHHVIPCLSTYRAEYFRAPFSLFVLEGTFCKIGTL